MRQQAPPGVQNERTAFAWQRTALSLAVATVALTRLAFERIGYAGLVCLVAAPLVLFVLLESRVRYRHRNGEKLSSHDHDGTGALLLAIAVLVLCVTGFAIVLRW